MSVTVSDIVHYVRAELPNRGCCRPAIVSAASDRHDRHVVNVHVFADGANDMPALRGHEKDQLIGSKFKRRVAHDRTCRPGTWHHPSECLCGEAGDGRNNPRP